MMRSCFRGLQASATIAETTGVALVPSLISATPSSDLVMIASNAASPTYTPSRDGIVHERYSVSSPLQRKYPRPHYDGSGSTNGAIDHPAEPEVSTAKILYSAPVASAAQ